jgi:hypothetical protein
MVTPPLWRGRVGLTQEPVQPFRRKEAHRPEGNLLHRYAKNPLAGEKMLRLGGRNIVEERLERGQSLVTGGNAAVAFPLEPAKIVGEQFRADVRDADLVGLQLVDSLAKDKKQLHRIPVGGNGVRAQVSLSRKVLGKKAGEVSGEIGFSHGRPPG